MGAGAPTAGGAGDAQQALPPPPRGAQGRDGALGTTAKLSALKSNTGEAGRRACAASVLMPLTAPAA
eukprot:2079448-Pleurochrysis_carterae.AAC.1